ncbi:MAG TPA: secretin N-terminal domain-containing protein [Pyrinomonadaceae bacterium]|nr:secretin N-terminal domain-containing protein [Pyrinomonadaceae bacterium]
MKSVAQVRRLAALLMVMLLLAAPVSVLAKKGDKNYNRGLEYEKAQQWEKAAAEFALAVAALPSDTEYQLHYRKALFNASQTFMTKGRALADQGDYVGAYNAFRQAYGLDPVNDLAAQEMEHVLRLQREREDANNPARRNAPATYRDGQQGTAPPLPDGQADGTGPREQLQTIQYNGDLEGFIRKLADELNLNVVFDSQFAQQKKNINVRWKYMTPARALDYVFLSNGLFFQKLDRRTILVADQAKRPQYQQLVLRTFYLYNIKPDEAQKLLQTSLPANAGRQPMFSTNPTTNSITVRDTPENIRIISSLLKGIDKDRAEVVMDVSIYEISRSDLLQIGNQLGSQTSLGNLGGLQSGSFLLGGGRQLAGAAAGSVLPLSTGVGLLIPSSSLAALQNKNNTRLLFSTQVHAFDDEKSSTRVGSKVPVQTASVYNGLVSPTTNGQNNGATGAVANNIFGAGGYPVIQYEDVGLNLDFKPKVYPNKDVQVSMTIESKDEAAGPDPLTPIFTQRKIDGVARIPDGKTMLIASIAQNRQTDGRQGLPLVGLVPILGRLFTTPTKNNSQSDIVITMTPRVLRAPEILPEDELSHPTGSMQNPQSESLEAMIRDADREDQFARLRSLPTNQNVQLPPQPGETVSYVPAPKALADVAAGGAQTAPTTTTADVTNNNAGAKPVNVSLETSGAAQPVASPAVITPNTPTNAAAKPNDTAAEGPRVEPSAGDPPAPAVRNASTAELLVLPEGQELKVGERRRVMVLLKTDAPVGLATATLRFDPRALAVRSVSPASLAADKSGAPVVTQSVDPKGVLVFSVSPAAGAQPLTGEGLLLFIEVEGLAAGDGSLQFDADKVHLIATDGRSVVARAKGGQLKVTQ